MQEYGSEFESNSSYEPSMTKFINNLTYWYNNFEAWRAGFEARKAYYINQFGWDGKRLVSNLIKMNFVEIK